jgi:hypothetical protein
MVVGERILARVVEVGVPSPLLRDDSPSGVLGDVVAVERRLGYCPPS